MEEALALVKKQRLFKQALVLYENDPALHQQVKRAFADYLQQRGYVQEAGFLYMSSEDPQDLEKSLMAFKKCGNVDMCFAVARKIDADIVQLRMDLVESLKESNRNVDAADLYCQVEGYDVETAVEYYTKGNAFMQAIREASK